MRTAHDDDVLESLPVVGDTPDEWYAVGAGDVRAGPALPTPRSSATFVRLTTLNPASLAGLPEWWSERARDSRVRAEGRLHLGAPQADASGTWRIPGWLHSSWLRRPIGVELQLWPRLGAWTKVSMQPHRRVRAGPCYFRLGHRALDGLIERLDRALPVTPR